MPKKNDTLRFIQFARRSIYSVGDLYSGYDQFQLTVESRYITTMQTPLDLVRMCTLPQEGTNSVAHMVNAMNKVLRDCIPGITMPFLDDIQIKGCPEEDMDESVGQDGCQKFIADHIHNCEKVLQRLERARLAFSEEKSAFGQSEIMVIGHLCGPFGRKPSSEMVETISVMKEECKSVMEVRRFLGVCAFYHIWIPHYTHVAEPLYGLLKKGKKIEWSEEHTELVQKMKEHPKAGHRASRREENMVRVRESDISGVRDRRFV